ncbi:hypothetical protein KR038_002807 [Drosophila bunnanda]|nr:hypothetical protein KR038_002807 [Drosophila bunnanda]
MARQFQIPQLQQHLQQQQRLQPMSLIPTKPFMGQGIPIELQQRVPPSPYLQQHYYYGGQPQPLVEYIYSPTSWAPQQDQLHQQYHHQSNQLLYGMPHVNSPKPFYPKSQIPGIIAPSINQHTNGTHKQSTTKTRSRPASKDQSSAEQGRSVAGDHSVFIQKTSADYCLNRNRSFSSLQHTKESRPEQSKDTNKPKTVPSKELAKPKEEVIQEEEEQQQDEKVVKKEIYIEKADEPGVGHPKRFAHFLRFRSAKKPKNKRNEIGFNDIDTQASLSPSPAKKHGFLSRLFGGVDSFNLPNQECLPQNPTDMPIDEIFQIDFHKAEGC